MNCGGGGKVGLLKKGHNDNASSITWADMPLIKSCPGCPDCKPCKECGGKGGYEISGDVNGEPADYEVTCPRCHAIGMKEDT